MPETRAVKLLSATLLICAGAICVAIGGLIPYGSAGILVGFVLLLFGIPMLIRQWTGEGLLTHLRSAWRRLLWTLWLAGGKAPEDESIEAEARLR
jgi:membrane-bound ClpP family serine protease